ncbi:hypothetical protein PIB30_058967 [Stylosanthes scabra]|uniref:Uncharacterized protein n=1 Tax=Stylosanthes scabra TaxID=79078 RepID=A0ABU6SLF8_9FABA|nr:hypothetical protein [Stylosanthes scabra]
MHVDICATAGRKKAAVIILPFHKHQRLDGSLETTRSDFKHVNRRVLENAPCSVGILVDRGLGGTSHISASNVSYSITVLFFGGGDDREALAYGARMAEHPGIRLTALRFVVEPSSTGEIVRVDMEESSSSGKLISEDEEFLNEFKAKIANDDSVTYEERAVKNAAETVAVIREFVHCNLVLVGRRPQGEVAYALNRSEYPELGPIGALLVSQDCPTIASVLVMQQYQYQ